MQAMLKVEGGFAHSLVGNLRTNDAFYLKNFKGISNMGYSPKQKDNLGLDKFISIGGRVSTLTTPIL